MNTKPAIALIPYGKFPNTGLYKMSLDDLEWPLGRPKRLLKGTISEMKKTDHLITNPRKSVFLFPRIQVKAQISVVICEPDIIHQKYINWAKFLSWRFYKILTRSENLLSKIDNGIFFLYVDTFIKDIDKLTINKSKLSSLIASNKKDLLGHKLRHKIVDFINLNNLNVDIMGRGYKPFENKKDGLSPYYYSVIIENIQEQNYFTEKLIDCFICETIPIYWGDPNIENHFDKRGMIICNSEKEIEFAIKSINIVEYESKLIFIEKNKQKAISYLNFEKRVSRAIESTI